MHAFFSKRSPQGIHENYYFHDIGLKLYSMTNIQNEKKKKP